VLSEYVPVAESCCWAPTLSMGEPGVTATDCKVTGDGAELPPPPPQALRLVRTTIRDATVVEAFIILPCRYHKAPQGNASSIEDSVRMATLGFDAESRPRRSRLQSLDLYGWTFISTRTDGGLLGE
jgi:hypothetical protein